MMSTMREFDWSYEIGMYAGTAGGLLVLALILGGAVLLVRMLLRKVSPSQSERP